MLGPGRPPDIFAVRSPCRVQPELFIRGDVGAEDVDLWGMLGLQIRREMTEEINLYTKAQREIIVMIIHLFGQ